MQDLPPLAWRLVRAALLGLAAAGLLAGCSTLSRPFGKSQAPVAVPLLEDAPPVAILAVDGPPERIGRKIAATLTAEAEKRGIRTHSGPPGNRDFRIKGRISADPGPGGVIVTYQWDVTDAIGAGRHRITGQQAAGGTRSSNPWKAVDDAVTLRIGQHTAEGLAIFLGQRGYDVRSIALAPPEQAAPGAPPPSQPGAADSVRRAAAPRPVAQPRTATLLAPVAVPTVTGTDKDSGRSLAQAMKSALDRHGVKLSETADATTFKVVGSVSVGPGKAGKVPVSIVWKVLDRADVFVGDVRQNNSVPAGSLDRGWAPIAKLVADAAAAGVLELLVKAR